MPVIGPRGALLVVEGCDRAGKTTQCKKLVETLCSLGKKAAYVNFPDRKTESGKLIDAYLTKKSDFSDQGIHLLFTLNRWEARQEMEDKLMDGTTLVVDRYSYSGVAFSAAKGLSLDWCKTPEAGLLRPDLVLYLNLDAEALSKRMGWGDERYDIPEFQRKVNKVFMELKDDKYWTVVNADRKQDDLTLELTKHSLKAIDKAEMQPLTNLW